jgi:hypothetical protein
MYGNKKFSQQTEKSEEKALKKKILKRELEYTIF